MAITTLAGYLTAPRYKIEYGKDSTGGGPSAFNTMWAATGNHTAGSLTIGNTTTGVVPTDATTGGVVIPNFSGTGYITGMEFIINDSAGNGPGTVWMYDRLFHAGSFTNTNGTVTLGSQPSYSSRVPGSDYNGIELFAESNGTLTTATTFNVTYTNQAGTAGRTSGSVTSAGAGASSGKVYRIPLASGDTGVQLLESFVISSAGTGNTWNIVVGRQLCRAVWRLVGGETVIQWIDRTGAPVIYNDSCLWTFASFSSSISVPAYIFDLEIASG